MFLFYESKTRKKDQQSEQGEKKNEEKKSMFQNIVRGTLEIGDGDLSLSSDAMRGFNRDGIGDSPLPILSLGNGTLENLCAQVKGQGGDLDAKDPDGEGGGPPTGGDGVLASKGDVHWGCVSRGRGG